MGEDGLVRLDVREIPFSRRGSWLDLSNVVAAHTVSEDVHLVSHRHGFHALLRCLPWLEDRPVPATVRADEALLTWSHDRGVVEAAFEHPDAVRLHGRGIGIRLEEAAGELTPFTGSYLFVEPVGGAAVLTSYETGHRYRVTVLRGSMTVQGDQVLGAGTRAVTIETGPDGEWDAVVEELGTSGPPYRSGLSFGDVVAGSRAAFRAYLETIAGWRTPDVPAAALAAYVMWSATVAPDGFVRREAVLMSKHWMDKVWSWDNCVNAVALAPGAVDLALDQLLVPFDHQDRSGALPDSVTHSEVLYNFVKPPIHGWAVRRIRELAERDLRPDELAQLHDLLARWTRFWLDHRRVPGHVLPHYQHGNDSGWDNATMFDASRVVEGPDLAAFLVEQLDVLAELAGDLGRPEDADAWRAERDAVGTALLEQLWDGEQFVARSPFDGSPSSATSLLPTMALLACRHLPPEVNAAVAERIGRHLTEFGLATELTTSDRYEPDGYWRGPVWAPSTLLAWDGLRRSGHGPLADEVSERFRRLCERSGFAENFDALTGAGLRDRAYTWTAATYLILAREAAGAASAR